jgi:hypothetical protein
MKYLKALGIAAVAAMVLTAFLGASSASATVLCKTTSTPCGAEWHYSTGTEIHATLKPGTKAIFSASGIIGECSESTIASKTTNTGSASETVDGKIEKEKLTWGSCTAEKTETVKGGLLEIHWIPGTDNGTVTMREVEWTSKSAGISCTYGAGEGIDLGTLTGGAESTISVNTIVNVTGGFLCPKTVTWTAEYVVTSPTPLFVSTN